MTLQIAPWDICFKSAEIKKHKWKMWGLSKWYLSIPQSQGKKNQMKPTNVRPTQPTQHNLCCYLPDIKLHIVTLFCPFSSQDFLWPSEFPASPRVMAHHSLQVIQLIPPLRHTSETWLKARTREDQWTVSTNKLQPDCSQQVMSLFPLCQTLDALLVPHE